MKSVRLILALTAAYLSLAGRADNYSPYDPLPHLAARVNLPATSIHPVSHGTAWLYEISADTLYYLTDWAHLASLTAWDGIELSSELSDHAKIKATLVGVATGYGVAVLSIPRSQVTETAVHHGKKAITKAYPATIPNGEVRIALYGYDLSPQSREDLTHALISRKEMTKVVTLARPDLMNPFEISLPTRLTKTTCPEAALFAPHCLEVPILQRVTGGSGLALSPNDTNQALLYLAGITLGETIGDTTSVLPIETALLAAKLIRTEAKGRTFDYDVTKTLLRVGAESVYVARGPLTGKTVRAAHGRVRPSAPDYLKDLPSPQASLDQNWAGFGFYVLAEDAVDKPDTWSKSSHLIDFPGFRRALPDLPDLARHRGGISVDGSLHFLLNGDPVRDVASFCALYLKAPSDRLSSPKQSFQLPEKLLLASARMGTRSYGDIRRILSKHDLLEKKPLNDTGISTAALTPLVRAYAKKREYSDPLVLVDLLVGQASHKNFAVVGNALLEVGKDSSRLITIDTSFGPNRLDLEGRFESDGPYRYRFVGPLRFSTESRPTVSPSATFTTKAWGVVTVDQLSSGGYQVTALVAYRAPAKAVGSALLLRPEKISVDAITFRAE